jgi:hypothetical protein
LVTSLMACAIRVASRSRSGSQQRHTLLDLQVRDDGEDVGVAGALAVAVDGALHVRGAGVDGRHRVGDRAPGVVVAVDAHPGSSRVEDVAHDVGDLGGQHPPVGVAQRDDLGAGLGRGRTHSRA